jgi:CheY-like chemotaxis protein
MPKTILVVDPHETTRSDIAKLIESWGYETITARNGSDAIHIVKAHSPDPFALIIIEVHMPDLDGLDFAHYLRSRHDETPLIFSSTSIGGQGEYSIERLMQFSEHFVLKPLFDIPAFRAKIEGLIGKPEPDAPALRR